MISGRRRPGRRVSERIGQEYFWIVCTHLGKLVILGPRTDEQEAQSYGYSKLEVPFDVIRLPTKDKARATSILKARRLDQTGNLDSALRRARHQAPMDFGR